MACLILGPAQASQNLPESRVVEILGYCHVLEDGGIGYMSEGKLSELETSAFREWFKTTEDPVAVICRLVADDSQRATAVVIASEELDDDHFYRVSLNALRRFADGEAGQKELEKVLLPGNSRSGVLAVHFRDPVLRATLKRCLDRGIANPDDASYANAILSGKAAQNVIDSQDVGGSDRYVRLAEKALKNEDGFKREPKPRPWLPQVATTTREVGTQWIWIVVIMVLMFTAWGVRKLRS